MAKVITVLYTKDKTDVSRTSVALTLFVPYSLTSRMFCCLWRCSLKVFHQHLCGNLLIDQHDFVADHHSAGASQILAATRCRPKFSVMISRRVGLCNSAFLRYLRYGQMTIGTNRFPNFVIVFFNFGCCRSSWTFVVLIWSLALFKMFVLFMGLCCIMKTSL